MDCCKRKIEEVLAARELYSLKCSLLAKQIFLFLLVLAKKSQCSACSRLYARKDHSSPLHLPRCQSRFGLFT